MSQSDDGWPNHSPFMIEYSSLVDRIATLHTQTRAVGATPPFAIANEWLAAAVDTTSARFGRAPVIVAVGANFATGPGKLPNAGKACHRSGPPWIELPLRQWRIRAGRHIMRCLSGSTKPHWNGLLPTNPDEQQVRALTDFIETDRFHFVMTNLSPRVTTIDWSKIRDRRLEDIFALLANPGTRGSMREYFKSLKRIVGPDALWIGHGNADVYGIFRHYCSTLNIRHWFFDSNLSQVSLF